MACVKGLNSAIYSIDMSHDGKNVVLGGGGKGIMLFDWDETSLMPNDVLPNPTKP